MRGAYAIIWSISSDTLNARFKASHHRLMTGFGYSNTQLSSQAPSGIGEQHNRSNKYQR